ncbi:MAG TPA: glycogen/starch synthase [Candidatus Saccharicenans sp.]|nr:glycogen/starch synthase [Candidatus Saccharicenans sp.]HQO75752.1 glycogen/starch synthase [Candidatus Saccharicenans sp.]HUM79476.1 glycogen/starch synthase [Candidatus Saccharicenans sp.]
MFKIAVLTPELSPYARSGELAEATTGLAKYLARAGHEVAVFLPYYRRPELESLNKKALEPELLVPIGSKKVKTTVFKAEVNKYRLYLIDQPKYFHRDYIYGSPKGDYLDNDERFIFFSRAVCEFLASARMKPEVIHCHNWAAAVAPLFLKSSYLKKTNLKKAATLLTIHNFSYQGEFPAESLSLTGLSWNYLNSHQLAFRGKFNFLKAGILFSEVVNTVSLTYRNEVLQYHHDVNSFFSNKNKPLYGLRNGLDVEEWNPATDPLIPANFSVGDLTGKKTCKKQLMKEFGLNLDESRPLLAVVGYLTRLKGLELVIEAINDLLAWGCQLVVAGQGNEIYEQALLKLKELHPGKLGVRLDLSPGLFHRVIAGADLLLMPSIEEPCGLTLMQALRYGTVPVARAVGGLKESMEPFSGQNNSGYSFAFEDYSESAFLQAVREALSFYSQPLVWKEIIARCLVQDNSWAKVIPQYEILYQKAVRLKRRET